MCQRRKIQPPTLRKYRTPTKQFQAFCDRKGYVTTNQIRIGDGELFSATWKDGAKAWGKKKERFQGLALYWGNREWIEHDMGF